MKKLSDIVRILSANSSLIILPGSNFALIILLTRYSTLAADTAYYFLAAWIGLMTLLDGGRALKVRSVQSRAVVYRVLASANANLCKAFFPVWIIICVVIAGAAFAKGATPAAIALYATATVFCGFVKILTDTLKTLALRSSSRMQADWLASAFAVGRVAAAGILLNQVPYPLTYLLSVPLEFLAFLLLIGTPWTSLPRLLRPRIRRGFAAHWDYLRVNLAYLVSTNADRIAAYYFVDEGTYKGLVLITSVLNVSIMPHKLIENEIVFPSSKKGTVPHHGGTPPLLALSMAAVGAGVIGCGFRVASSGKQSDAALAALLSGLWLAVTLVYNKTWATRLHSGDTGAIAQQTLIAGAVSFMAPLVMYPLYNYMLPVAVFAYGAVNIAALSMREQGIRKDGALYLLAVLPFCLIGWQFMGLIRA